MSKKAMAKIVEINKQELSTEKVELARKPKSILTNLIRIDEFTAKSSSKMDKAYLNYKKAQQEFESTINRELDNVRLLGTDILDVKVEVRKLGLDNVAIPDLDRAEKLSKKLTGILSNYKKLYPEI
jgi:hypothetical protein